MDIQALLREAVLIHDYRSGTFQDLSNNGNHGVPTDVKFNRNGLKFPESTSVVTVADSAELQLTEGTLIILDNFNKQESGRLISKRDGGGTNYEFRIANSTQLGFYDGVSEKAITTTVVGKKYLACNFANGEICELFIDGISKGNFGSATSISVDDADVHIGNNYIPNSNIKTNFKAVLIFPRKLTATEHSVLYGYLESIQYPTITESKEKDFRPDEVTDGDMEASGVSDWTVVNSAVLSKITTNTHSGTQALRITSGGISTGAAIQSPLTVGEIYKATGWARGDGINPPRFYNYGTFLWGGIGSTTWQYFEVVFVANHAQIRFRFGNTTGYVEFDDVQITEVGKNYSDLSWHTDWGVYESVSALTSGKLENSPITVESGSFKISRDSINDNDVKVIECVTLGTVSIPTSHFHQTESESAYGEWEVWLNKKASSTIQFRFVLDELFQWWSAGSGYQIKIDSSEILRLESLLNGDIQSTLFTSASAVCVADEWFKLKITRSSTGEFSVYIDDVLVVAGTGTNPITNNTYTESKYMEIGMEANDKISYASLTGDYSIIKRK